VPRLVVVSLVFLRSVPAQCPHEPFRRTSELFRNANGDNGAFSAVGQFRGVLTCTGSLIDPSGLSWADARAWLATAIHCISLESYGVIQNEPLTAQVQFKFFCQHVRPPWIWDADLSNRLPRSLRGCVRPFKTSHNVLIGPMHWIRLDRPYD